MQSGFCPKYLVKLLLGNLLWSMSLASFGPIVEKKSLNPSAIWVGSEVLGVGGVSVEDESDIVKVDGRAAEDFTLPVTSFIRPQVFLRSLTASVKDCR